MNTKFSLQNKKRCESPQGFNHSLDSWSSSDWFTAVLGELGEAANIAKKLNRIRDGIPGNASHETKEYLLDALAEELADTQIYLDLLAQVNGISLNDAAIRKFNMTSKKIGYPVILNYQAESQFCAHNPPVDGCFCAGHLA